MHPRRVSTDCDTTRCAVLGYCSCARRKRCLSCLLARAQMLPPLLRRWALLPRAPRAAATRVRAQGFTPLETVATVVRGWPVCARCAPMCRHRGAHETATARTSGRHGRLRREPARRWAAAAARAPKCVAVAVAGRPRRAPALPPTRRRHRRTAQPPACAAQAPAAHARQHQATARQRQARPPRPSRPCLLTARGCVHALRGRAAS